MGKWLQMAKRLLLFGIADPRPLSTLPLHGFRLFPQECEGIASFFVFSRGWLLASIYVFLRLPRKRKGSLQSLTKEYDV